MAFNDFQLSLVGHLDGTKSKNQLNQDIKAISGVLDKLKLKGEFDQAQIQSLERQLNSLSVELNNAIFSQAAISGLVDQINRELNGIKIQNISIDNNAQQVGQQVGQQISQGIKQNIDTNVVNIDTTTAQKEIEEIITITDNYGRELDELHSKQLSTSKMMNTQGKLITLFHGSKRDFDSFDISASDRHSNNYGQGAYFFDNPSNSIGYGNVSQWFANVEKIFDSSAKLSEQEIQTIYDRYKSQIKECLDIDNLMDFTSYANSGSTVDRLRTLSDFLGLPTDNSLLKGLGYDAILSRGFDVNEYIILDENKIIKANSALKEQVSLITSVQEAKQMETNADPKRNFNKSIMDGWKKKREAEKQSKEDSTVSTQAIIQNEEKKQQAIQETARITESLNNEDNSDRIKNLAVEKAKARSELDKLRKEIESEAGIKVSASDVRQAQKEVEQSNKAQQEGTRENIKLREQEVAHTKILAKETKANADLEIANRQREMKLANQSSAEELADRKRISQESKTSVQEELTSRENLRKLNEQTFKEESTARKQAIAETRLQAQEQKALISTLNLPTEDISKKIKNDTYSTDIEVLERNFQKYGLSVEEAAKKVSTLRETLLGMKDLSGEELIRAANKLSDEFADANVELTKIKLTYDKIAEVNKIKLSLDDGSYDSKVESLIEKTRRWTDENGNARISTKNLSNALTELSVAFENGADKEKIISLAKTLDSEMNKVTNSIRTMNAEYAKDSEILSFNKQVTEFYDKNSKAHTKFGKALRKMMEDTSVGAGRTNAELDEMKKNFINIQNSARQTGKLGLSFFDSIKQQVSKFAQWFGVSSIVTTGIGQFKKMAQAVYDIDTAMTNLYKVTDETDERYTKFLDNACDKAGELGRTVSSLVEQTANWSKLGYSLDDAERLAEISSIYANVGEVDDETAVSDMVTAMKAFNIEASDAITIVDRLNALGNKYATSAKDLGTGLSNSASALALAGNSIDETLAMITAMTEITQDASESGNALKILSMRLRGMKGELEALGEESEGLESISKIQTQILNLTGGKVNIFNDDGSFKSTYEIMQGISKVWTEISQTNQAELLEIIAGKQRGNSISALLTNMAQANNALNDSLRSSGSAYEEQNRWLESMDAKTKQFQAAFESLSNTILDSDLLKFFVDLGTASLNTINEIISGFSSLGALFMGGLGTGAFAFLKNLD